MSVSNILIGLPRGAARARQVCCRLVAAVSVRTMERRDSMDDLSFLRAQTPTPTPYSTGIRRNRTSRRSTAFRSTRTKTMMQNHGLRSGASTSSSDRPAPKHQESAPMDRRAQLYVRTLWGFIGLLNSPCQPSSRQAWRPGLPAPPSAGPAPAQQDGRKTNQAAAGSGWPRKSRYCLIMRANVSADHEPKPGGHHAIIVRRNNLCILRDLLRAADRCSGKFAAWRTGTGLRNPATNDDRKGAPQHEVDG